MTDVLTQTEDQAADELNVLKQRARLMGINFSNNISIDKLRQRISDRMEGKPEETNMALPEANPLEGESEAPATPLTIRERLLRDEMKLVRCRIQNLDPKKKDLHGEIFTIANEYLGTVRKFVPYGEVTDDGYHLPWCIYRLLQEKQFLNIRSRRDPRSGQERIEHNWVREYSLEVLPPLTPEELARLAAAQAAAGGTND